MAEETRGAQVGRRIRALRDEMMLARTELAERSGLSVPALLHLEQGEVARPRRRTIEKIAAGLGVEPDALLHDSGATEATQAPKVRAPLSQEKLFNNGVLATPAEPAERRIDFEACARTIDGFSGYWATALRDGRILDRQELSDFVAAVKAIVLLLSQVRPVADAADVAAMHPAMDRFVAVAAAVADQARDRAAAVAEVRAALGPLAA